MKGKKYRVIAKWSIFYGKEVEVISCADMIIDGQMQWNCVCTDGSGGGILPENSLKPIEE